MIKENELRIGNLVKVSGVHWPEGGSYKGEPNGVYKTATVLSIQEEGINEVELKGGLTGHFPEYALDEWMFVFPIPLTEEWLLNFDFEKWGPSWYKKGRIFISIEKFRCDLNGDAIESSLPFPNYVHQLQNLYFALTGQELTINLQG